MELQGLKLQSLADKLETIKDLGPRTTLLNICLPNLTAAQRQTNLPNSILRYFLGCPPWQWSSLNPYHWTSFSIPLDTKRRMNGGRPKQDAEGAYYCLPLEHHTALALPRLASSLRDPKNIDSDMVVDVDVDVDHSATTTAEIKTIEANPENCAK